MIDIRIDRSEFIIINHVSVSIFSTMSSFFSPTVLPFIPLIKETELRPLDEYMNRCPE